MHVLSMGYATSCVLKLDTQFNFDCFPTNFILDGALILNYIVCTDLNS